MLSSWFREVFLILCECDSKKIVSVGWLEVVKWRGDTELEFISRVYIYILVTRWIVDPRSEFQIRRVWLPVSWPISE